MKITSQSADELVLTEGSTSGMVVGAVLIVAGVLAAIFLRQSNSIALWIGLALVVVGIVVILFSSSISLVMNKTRGQVAYSKKRLVGGQNSTYPISDIFRIETRKQWQLQNTGQSGNQGGAPQQVLVAQSVMVFKDGRELALDHQKTSSSTSVGGVTLMGGQGAETAIAAQVANFLGVPFQEIMPPNMSSGINIQF
jgi:Tfp pilus assembly PilM family ATPase